MANTWRMGPRERDVLGAARSARGWPVCMPLNSPVVVRERRSKSIKITRPCAVAAYTE